MTGKSHDVVWCGSVMTTGDCFPSDLLNRLEDTSSDVIGKALRGLSLSERDLAERAGLSPDAIRAILKGGCEEESLQRAARVLGLGPRSLTELACGRYHPATVRLPEGLFRACTPFGDMLVNSYVVWDPDSPSPHEGAFFDTGGDADPMLEFAAVRGLAVRQLFLTHIHGDHVFDLDRVVERTGAAAYVSVHEPIGGAESFLPGTTFAIGSLKVSTRRTSGHADGGITYVVEGLAKPVAVVGDALFAGSIGGGVVSYAEALRMNRSEILSLPEETILCPGHGPLTTVGEQNRANPFFAS